MGINISDNSIKIAQIGNKGQITALNKITVPDGFIVNGEIIKHAEVVKLLKDLIRETNKKSPVFTNEAICSLPEKFTYLKYAKMPPSSNINTEINNIIAESFPEEIDKLYVDWQIVNQKKAKLSNEPIEIMIGACSKELIESYIKVFEEAGIILISLEIESLAIARAVADMNPLESLPLGIIDIGAKSSIFIIYNKNVRFSIIISFSGDKITNLLAATLNITPKQAEKAKILCGLDQKKAKGAVKKVLTPLTADLLKKIKEIENYYINYLGGENFSKILLTGGAANLQGIDKLIQEGSQVKVEICDPLINLKTNLNEVKESKQELLSYATAMGLALNGIKS
ncbi:MAG: type IV pilus assembly protein PilM [bacterium]